MAAIDLLHEVGQLKPVLLASAAVVERFHDLSADEVASLPAPLCRAVCALDDRLTTWEGS